MHHPPNQPAIQPLRVSLTYALAAILWLFLSGALLSSLIHDPGALYFAQTLNIIVFILLTARALFLLLRTRRQNLLLLQTAFEELVESASFSHEKDFFRELAEHLVKVTGQDYVLIAEYQQEVDQLAILIAYGDGSHMEDGLYPIEGTPCERTLTQGIYCCKKDAQGEFPSVPLLEKLSVQSYIGHALYTGEGKPLGLIALMDRAPLKATSPTDGLLRILTTRAALEMERRSFFQRIQRSDQQLQAVLDSFPSPLIGLNDQLNVIRMNPAAERLLGRSQAESVDTPLSHLLSAKGQEETLEPLQKLARKNAGANLRIPFVGLRPDGSTVSCVADTHALVQGDGMRLLLGLNQDAPSEAGGGEASIHWSQIVNRLDVAVALLGPEGEVRYQNSRAEQWFGSGGPGLSPNDLASLPAEKEIPLPDGTGFYQRNDAVLQNSDETPMTLAVMKDISHIKADEQLRSHVIGALGHEIRTPLTAVLGYTELMLSRQIPEESKNKYLNLLRSEGERIETLINRALHLQRLPLCPSPNAFEEVRPDHLLANLKEHLRPLREKIELDFNDATQLPPVQVHKEHLSEILLQLLTVTVRFVPDGAIIRLEAQESEQRIQLRFRDGTAALGHEEWQGFTEQFDVPRTTGQSPGVHLAQRLAANYDWGLLTGEARPEGCFFQLSIPVVSM